MLLLFLMNNAITEIIINFTKNNYTTFREIQQESCLLFFVNRCERIFSLFKIRSDKQMLTGIIFIKTFLNI